MAVEARHLNLFPPQILTNRDMMMNAIEGNGNMIGTQIGYVTPLSGTTTATQNVFPMYGSGIAVPAKNSAMRSESGLTYASPISRKRSRDANMLLSSFSNVSQNRCSTTDSYSFLGEDISHQIQLQQLEIDRFISHHTEKVRMEIEEKRRNYSRRMAMAVEENVMKRLKAREDEIEKMGKLNWALEERVKSLCVENQLWKDLAHSNEAAANTLRSNLEQVLAQVHDDNNNQNRRHVTADDVADDAESCCGSNDETDRNNRLADCAATTTVVDQHHGRICRSCGREESCVLLLPCRHLCLCTFCGSSVHTCPVCNSVKTASVHVNLS